MSLNHYTFTLSKSLKKHIKYDIFNPIDGSLLYYLKQRKNSNITPLKSEFYIINTDHQYISSIYPLQKSESFTGKFELTDGGTYTFDYQREKFNLSIDGQYITFSKGAK